MNINAALGYINYPRIALACWALRKIASRFAPRRGNEPIADNLLHTIDKGMVAGLVGKKSEIK